MRIYNQVTELTNRIKRQALHQRAALYHTGPQTSTQAVDRSTQQAVDKSVSMTCTFGTLALRAVKGGSNR